MKKLFAIIMVVAMMASLSSVVFAAEGTGPSPLVAYDFRDSKLADTTGNHADIVLDEEYEGRPEEERKNGNSASAVATEDGIDIWNGYFRLPENLFSDLSVNDISGLTYSITFTKHAGWWGNEWSENLFNFSTDWHADVVEGDDNNPDRSVAFYTSFNGNVGTARRPYSSTGNYMDGTLGIPFDEEHTVTVTYDIASDTAIIYLDGARVHSSADTEWEVLCDPLTAEDIHNFKANAVGFPAGGNWGMWAFMCVKDVTVYAQPLTDGQVASLVADGWEAVAGGATSEPPAQSGNNNNEDPGKAPETGFATIALAVAAIGSGAYVVSKKRH